MRRLQHNDEPAVDDAAIRRDDFVMKLAEQIAHCTPPQVFGVHGEWGAGKTSLLLQLQKHLSWPGAPEPRKLKALQDEAGKAGRPRPSHHDDRVFTLWFEAWRYQHEAVPVVALIQEMRRQFSLALRARETLKAGGSIALKALVGAFDTAVSAVGAEHAKLLNPGNILKAADSYDAAQLRAKLPTDTVRDFLTQAIKALLVGMQRDGKENPRIVIFIDDLDRCSSDAAYRLLEGLKIHLSLENCVFVLGMNQGAVIDLLAPQFSKKEDEKIALPRAESYLEKLCANVWRLPPIGDPFALLCHWLYVQGDGDKIADTGDLALQQKFQPLASLSVLRSSLPPNPRKLKALANTLLTLWQGGAEHRLRANDMLHLQCLLFVAYVYQFHHGLYQRWVLAPDFFETLREWAEGKSMIEDRKLIFERLVRTSARVAAPAPPSPPGSPSVDPEKSVVSASSLPAPQTLYPEPGLHGLFWMTPWLLDSSGGQSAKSTDFAPLLTVYQPQTLSPAPAAAAGPAPAAAGT